jgi:rubredoxin
MIYTVISKVIILNRGIKKMKCKNCSYQFDPTKEGNSKKRKCGMCCFADSYSVRSKKEYERNLLTAMIESLQH